jgi:hypothetical protein
MAHIILKGLGAEPLVSEAVIDGGDRKVVSERQCKVTMEVKTGEAGVQFTRVDDALPMPIPDDAKIVLSIPEMDLLNDLSKYMLTVSNLPSGQYDVFVDGDKVSSHSAEELGKGVNMTMECGPIRKQALDLFKQVITKNDLYFERWRKVQLYEAPKWLKDVHIKSSQEAELKRLDKEIAEKELQIDQLRQPKAHLFKVLKSNS